MYSSFRPNPPLISNLNSSHSSFNIPFHLTLPERIIPGDRYNLYWVLPKGNLVLYLKESASLLRSWPYKCLLATYTISCWVGWYYQSDDAESLLLTRPGYWLSIPEVLASHVAWHPPEGRREKELDWGGKAHTLGFSWAWWSRFLCPNWELPSVTRRKLTVRPGLHLHLPLTFFSVLVPLTTSWGYENKDTVGIICVHFSLRRTEPWLWADIMQNKDEKHNSQTLSKCNDSKLILNKTEIL